MTEEWYNPSFIIQCIHPLTRTRITPSLFASTSTDDEWSLCNSLGKTKCSKALEKHWSSFTTLGDFEDIKSAGLNAVRIPIGYWAVDLLDYEPYVSGQYPYLIRAVQWAGELGLQVLIDLHGVSLSGKSICAWLQVVPRSQQSRLELKLPWKESSESRFV